jgi:hypothetical protein
MDIKSIIESGDAATLQQLLASEPELANAAIPWGGRGELLSRPLHYICDKFFDRTLSDDAAVRLARVVIDAGGDIDDRNGDPLNAAASLGATGVGLLLLDAGTRTDGRGLFGATALHWAAYTGNAVLVRRLLEKGAPTDVKDNKHQSTPLGWALVGRGKPTPPGDHGHHDEVIAALGGT